MKEVSMGTRKRRYLVTVAVLIMLAFAAWAEKPSCPWIDIRSALQERELAPRSTLLTGTFIQRSKSNTYVISFPEPNECVTLKNIQAESRVEALYRGISEGGFTIKHSRGALTVWTAEEWEEAARTLPDDFRKAYEARCKGAR
ncbi:MAG: hypothetical protein ACRDQZ_25130 [Mycobacteriales bacterium]